MTNKVKISEVIGGGYNRFWNNKQFYRVVKGSRGSKKSKNTALNFISRIMEHPWANLLVVRRYSNTNRQSTFTDLKWAAQRLGVLHLFDFPKSLLEITYKPTGQKILLRGLDDPLKITSISVEVGMLSWVWFEEAYQIESMEAFDTVVESIRGSHDAPEYFKQITLSFNPWSDTHWLKREFFDEETQRRDTFATTTTFRCNEWLDEVDRQRYEDLYRTNPRRSRIVCDGEWGVAEGLIFDSFQAFDFDPIAKIKEIQVTAHGNDYGFTNDPTTLISTVVDLEKKELWIYDEHYEKAMSTQDIYDMHERKGLLSTVITGDSAEPRLISELVSKGMRRLQRSIKGKGSIMQGIQFIQGFKVYIHPSCVHTIEEFNTYVFKQNKEGKWLNEPIDDNNHLIDALRYSLERYHIKRINNVKDKHKAIQSLGL